MELYQSLLARKSEPQLAFVRFADLPTEIRCYIWQQASPIRPRVVQIAYDPQQQAWNSCKDSCGGLSVNLKVSREARQEVLKTYWNIFGTWIHMEEDTIMISDPVFLVRKPREKFMSLEVISKIRRVALTGGIYEELEDMHGSFPELVDRPMSILRALSNLTYFALVLTQDGLDVDFRSSDAIDSDSTESDDLSELSNANSPDSESSQDDTIAGSPEIGLQRLEDLVMFSASRGYFRDVGLIHFEAAENSADHFDSLTVCLTTLQQDSILERYLHPGWVPPRVSIVEVKYGLDWIGREPVKQYVLDDNTFESEGSSSQFSATTSI